jgi:hypothetical protein
MLMDMKLQDLHNFFLEERRFCYDFLRACLTLNIFDGQPIWKHTSLHELFFYKTRKQTIICGEQYITLHMRFIYD